MLSPHTYQPDGLSGVSIGNCNLECGFALNMLSALIRSELSYSAMLLVQQLTHQRFVHPGPLVLGAAILTIPTRPHRI